MYLSRDNEGKGHTDVGKPRSKCIQNVAFIINKLTCLLFEPIKQTIMDPLDVCGNVYIHVRC